MLTWESVQEHRATCRNGTYRIVPAFGPAPPRCPYVAVLSWFDERGRLFEHFEHVVGFFDSVPAAKTACETDAKS